LSGCHTLKRSTELAGIIEAEIESRQLPPGFLLGSEPELCQSYGVSRAILREAVRLLEHHQLVRMKTGRGGGLIVSEPDVGALTGGLALLLRRQGVEPSDLALARLFVEGTCVRLATERLTPEGIADIHSCLEMEDRAPVRSVREHAAEFHLLVARLSANPILQVFTTILVTLTAQRVGRPSKMKAANDSIVRAHHRIAEAMIAGDSGKAQLLMDRHFEAMSEAWRSSNAAFPQLQVSTFMQAGSEGYYAMDDAK
jgi:DNA-binding FadR family transcriptional regulator